MFKLFYIMEAKKPSGELFWCINQGCMVARESITHVNRLRSTEDSTLARDSKTPGPRSCRRGWRILKKKKKNFFWSLGVKKKKMVLLWLFFSYFFIRSQNIWHTVAGMPAAQQSRETSTAVTAVAQWIMCSSTVEEGQQVGRQNIHIPQWFRNSSRQHSWVFAAASRKVILESYSVISLNSSSAAGQQQQHNKATAAVQGGNSSSSSRSIGEVTRGRYGRRNLSLLYLHPKIAIQTSLTRLTIHSNQSHLFPLSLGPSGLTITSRNLSPYCSLTVHRGITAQVCLKPRPFGVYFPPKRTISPVAKPLLREEKHRSSARS